MRTRNFDTHAQHSTDSITPQPPEHKPAEGTESIHDVSKNAPSHSFSNMRLNAPDFFKYKLAEANNSTAQNLDNDTRPALEKFLSEDLSHVKVHNNVASHEAAGAINAKAYTSGNHIFLGSEANSLSPMQRRSLLAHEAVHTIQQKSFSGNAIQTKSTIDSPASGHEKEAESLARDFSYSHGQNYKSSALAIRRHNRIGTISSPLIQRNIKDNKELTNGKMELDFTKKDAAVAGDEASEEGWVKFHPNNKSPESNDIKLIQIVRTIDVGGATTKAGNPADYSKVGAGEEADRNKVSTTKDDAKNVAGGFFVDHSAAKANPRTKKADAPVLPYYNAYWDGDTGKRKGKDKASATLWDGPSSTAAIKFNFVTSAKANDTGFWYGSALWGFEIYLDKGVAKIKNEYNSFREYEGETTHAALQKFNEFYKNKGTAGAPTK